MSKASLIHVSKDLIQAVNKELYSFIWKGKDKVKRLALINDIENGGLQMLDIESMVLAQRTMCLKKYIEDYVSPGRIFLKPLFEKLGESSFCSVILIAKNAHIFTRVLQRLSCCVVNFSSK